MSANKYAIGYRCARKKIDKFYDNSGCQTQICGKVCRSSMYLGKWIDRLAATLQ